MCKFNMLIAAVCFLFLIKENLHFDDQSKLVVFFFSLRKFLKDIEDVYRV